MKPPFIPETNFSCPNASGFGRINTFGRVLSIQRDFAPDLCDFHSSSLTVVKKILLCSQPQQQSISRCTCTSGMLENPERSGTERNGTGSNCCTIRMWMLDTWPEICVNFALIRTVRFCVRTLIPCSVLNSYEDGTSTNREPRQRIKLLRQDIASYVLSHGSCQLTCCSIEQEC